MRTSNNETLKTDEERRIAFRAECAYLVNLLALPLVGTLYCIYLARKHLEQASPALRQHLLFTAWGSLVAPGLLAGMTLFFYFMLGLTPHFWFATLSFLAIFHTSFVILGLYTLAKAMSGKGL